MKAVFGASQLNNNKYYMYHDGFTQLGRVFCSVEESSKNDGVKIYFTPEATDALAGLAVAGIKPEFPPAER